MGQPIVLFALNLSPELKGKTRERLEHHADIRFFDELSPEAFEKLVPNIDAFVRYGFYKPFPDEYFRRMKRLKLIQLMSAGTQFLDDNPAIPDDVVIQGARGANSAAVAEQAMAHVLALAKSLPQHDRMLRNKLFDQRKTTRCLAESTMGILGLGSIGTEIAKRALGFEMEVHAIDQRTQTDLPLAFIGGMDSLKCVLKVSDFLVLSLPLTEATNGLIGKRELSLMKEDACLINVGRGHLVDQRALYEHLQAHPQFKAGLDVWWNYPAFTSELIESYWGYPFEYPFHLLDNVIMTPHMGAYSGRCRERMLNVVLDRLSEYLASSKDLTA